MLPWWGDVLFALAVITAIWGFLSLVGFRAHMVSDKTDRRAEDLYPGHAGLSRRQRRQARDHGGPR